MIPDYYEPFKQAAQQIYPGLTLDEWQFLKAGLRVLELRPKDHFFQVGHAHHSLGFVSRGLVRSYYLNEQGEEVTIYFAKENDYATDYSSFISQTPSRYSFQCLEPTTLLTFSYQHQQQCYQTYHGLERYGRLVGEEVIKMLNARTESFLFESAQLRYLRFINEHPGLLNRVSIAHLASFLGIERPSLSRIRRQVSDR